MARKTTKKKTTRKGKAKTKRSKAPAGRPMRMTDEEKETILSKAKEGMNARQISEQVNRSYVTVLNLINKGRRGPKPKGRRGRAGARSAADTTPRLRTAQKAFDSALEELLQAKAEAANATLIERLRAL